VRELRNILERASLLCDGDEILLQHLPLELVTAACTLPGAPPQYLPAQPDSREREAVSLAEQVRHFRGNRKALARHLGLSERTLYRRLKCLTKT
jgi:two-component system response regulator HydG